MIVSGVLLLFVVLLFGILIGNNSNISATQENIKNSSSNIDTSQLNKCNTIGEIIRTEPFKIKFCLKVDDSNKYFLTEKILDMPEFATYMYCSFNVMYHSTTGEERVDSKGNIDTLFGKINDLGYRKSFGPYSIYFGDSDLKSEIRQVESEKELLVGYVSKYPEDISLLNNLVEYQQIMNEHSQIFSALLNPDTTNRDQLREELFKIDEISDKVSDKIINNCITVSEKLKYQFKFPSQTDLIANFGILFYDDFDSLLS